ncbi:DUF2769 domain-containing protein [bacterium]|nr:DUF2769 domain-containing protein [bacterium]
MTQEQAAKSCICGYCPSYFNCGEKLAFCLSQSGKSKCIVSEFGCVCPGCPIQQELGFDKIYYCTRGSEKDLKVII